MLGAASSLSVVPARSSFSGERQRTRKQRMSGLVRVVLLCFPVSHTRFLHLSLFVVFTLNPSVSLSPSFSQTPQMKVLPVDCLCVVCVHMRSDNHESYTMEDTYFF